ICLGSSFYIICFCHMFFFFFSSRRRHTRCLSDWSSDVCSSDLTVVTLLLGSGFLDIVQRARVAQPVAIRALEAAGAYRLLRLWEIGRASCRERVGVGVGAGVL